MTQIPQGLTDALVATQAAKDDADAARLTAMASAAAVRAAQATADTDESAAQQMAQTLAAKHDQLLALLDAYFKVGATAPAQPGNPDPTDR